MRIKKTGKGIMTIKIDLEMAYDGLSWAFIKDTLQQMGLPNRLSKNIMHCIESTRMSICGMANN